MGNALAVCVVFACLLSGGKASSTTEALARLSSSSSVLQLRDGFGLAKIRSGAYSRNNNDDSDDDYYDLDEDEDEEENKSNNNSSSNKDGGNEYDDEDEDEDEDDVEDDGGDDYDNDEKYEQQQQQQQSKRQKSTKKMEAVMTRSMRRILSQDLGYKDIEISRMDPQIAVVVIERELQRPTKGMPDAWVRKAPTVPSSTTSSKNKSSNSKKISKDNSKNNKNNSKSRKEQLQQQRSKQRKRREQRDLGIARALQSVRRSTSRLLQQVESGVASTYHTLEKTIAPHLPLVTLLAVGGFTTYSGRFLLLDVGRGALSMIGGVGRGGAGAVSSAFASRKAKGDKRRKLQSQLRQKEALESVAAAAAQLKKLKELSMSEASYLLDKAATDKEKSINEMEERDGEEDKGDKEEDDKFAAAAEAVTAMKDLSKKIDLAALTEAQHQSIWDIAKVTSTLMKGKYKN